MKIRRIDSEGDWDYGHSMSSYYIDNAQSVGLNIITRLREWYQDNMNSYYVRNPNHPLNL